MSAGGPPKRTQKVPPKLKGKRRRTRTPSPPAAPSQGLFQVIGRAVWGTPPAEGTPASAASAPQFTKVHNKLIIFDFDGVLSPVDAVTSDLDIRDNIRQEQKRAATADAINKNGGHLINDHLNRLKKEFDLIVCSLNNQERLNDIVPRLYGHDKFSTILGLGHDGNKLATLQQLGVFDMGYTDIYFFDDDPTQISTLKHYTKAIGVYPPWQATAFDFLQNPETTACTLLKILDNVINYNFESYATLRL